MALVNSRSPSIKSIKIIGERIQVRLCGQWPPRFKGEYLRSESVLQFGLPFASAYVDISGSHESGADVVRKKLNRTNP